MEAMGHAPHLGVQVVFLINKAWIEWNLISEVFPKPIFLYVLYTYIHFNPYAPRTIHNMAQFGTYTSSMVPMTG